MHYRAFHVRSLLILRTTFPVLKVDLMMGKQQHQKVESGPQTEAHSKVQ